MTGYPPVSAMCLTYGRTHLLEEAIHSFLIQDYPGPKELVVLNDFADQTLVCDHAEVRIINTSMRFPSVGEKRNACATLAKHDILFVWDDDDIYLPWRLSLSIQRMDRSRGYYKSPQAWILSDGQMDGPSTNLFHSASCLTRDLFERAGCYPHTGSGEDWDLEDRIHQLIPTDKDDYSLTPQELYYLYRWHGTGSYHLSAFGRDEGQAVTGNQKVAEFVEGQVREGKVHTGMVRLHPAWKTDYLQLVQSHLKQPATPKIVEVVGQSLIQEPEQVVPANSARIAESNPVVTDTASPSRQKSSNDERQIPTRGGLPLVSCVMPTYGRPDYVAESIAMFLAQDYPAKELIILNNCPGQKLLGDFPDVRIFNSEARWPTLGEKRNAAIELAQGQYIAVWDDDDIYMPWRLSHSMRRIHELNTPLYCPADYWAYWGSEDLHENQAQLNWIYHPLVIFDKELWRTTGGYPAQTLSEDTVFFKKVLNHLGIEWPRDPISRHDRVMIMRAKSKYAHTSISGGTGGPDIRPGEIEMMPGPIADPVLQRIAAGLIQRRERNTSRRLASQNTIDSMRRSATGENEIWLDRLSPQTVSVGFGEAGFNGRLGYEGKNVEVCGGAMPHAISAHAPSRLVYDLNGRFETFRSRVAINDTAPDDATHAEFYVLADGVVCGVAKNVRPGQVPRIVSVDVRGVQRLELLVQTRRWSSCHAVWADPILVSTRSSTNERVVIDALQRAQITIPADVPRTELCIATVGSKGFEEWIDDLFGSVCANAQCTQALLAIFSLGDSPEIRRVADKYRAVVIPCRPLRALNASSKSVLYAAGHVLQADKFICLDADMLVLEDLRPVVAMIDAAPIGSILTCREANWARDLEQAVTSIYGGVPDDISLLTGEESVRERRYPFIVNDGIFAGSRAALCALDSQIRCLSQPERWIDDPVANKPWRNQFILNLALAQADCGVELDAGYNIQAQSQPAEFIQTTVGITAQSHGMPAGIIHFNGVSKHQALDWRGRYRSNPRPLTRTETGSFGYEVFTKALKQWVGHNGIDALTWSFYGTSDGTSANLTDASTFPLFAALHYLIRTNGCCRVIETGTARGVSAACIASAIAHRPGAAIVTIDIDSHPDREKLWAALPTEMRQCIMPRQNDAFEGLRLALSSGESYQAALLDTVHTAEHVLQEFELARKLVCPGGLILVHDAILRNSTVGQALDAIQGQGYGVTRLWTADQGAPEDDRLGLAVIENRQRSL